MNIQLVSYMQHNSFECTRTIGPTYNVVESQMEKALAAKTRAASRMAMVFVSYCIILYYIIASHRIALCLTLCYVVVFSHIISHHIIYI